MCSVTEKPRRIGTLDSGFHASDGDDRMGTGQKSKTKKSLGLPKKTQKLPGPASKQF